MPPIEDRRVCGYSLDGPALLAYGVKKGWGTDKTAFERVDTMFDTVRRLFQKHTNLRTQVCGVVKPVQPGAEVNLFLAVACMDPRNFFPLPAEDDPDFIELKKLLKATKPPRWTKMMI
ncbi:uncharacterized protein EV420DRAFT_1647611 [Desarmillaria tabescens]|uniref:Uncharacterized protein n=1 Tax=Armillaria tabescens TaxID=1929756 RepID=A0AA39JSB8_ARMTA|nr:uncharacterized protein EV420DRAFT_1647611 [Desarmillaria tabescens]KAK0447869.1 hypothetical protein EV420DRAFT_1647611 [Desarmillaria tabescens]